MLARLFPRTSAALSNPSKLEKTPRATSRWLVRGGVAAIFAAGCTTTIPAAAENLVIQGSTTFNSRLLEPYKRAIETMSGVTLQVIPNKSFNGLAALLSGRADLAMISAPLDRELVALRNGGHADAADKLQGHTIANTRIAFALHPSNPLRKSDLGTIRQILNGKIVDWRQIGGPDLPIRVVFVAKAGGVTQTVQSRLLDDAPITAAYQVALSSPEQVVKVVAQEPGALGLAQIRLLAAHSLPELSTEETIDQILLLVSMGPPAPAAQAVLDAARKIAPQRLASSRN